MKRTLAILMCAMALLAGACGASGDEEGATEEEEGTEVEQGGGDSDGAMWGDLESPCGDGDATARSVNSGDQIESGQKLTM